MSRSRKARPNRTTPIEEAKAYEKAQRAQATTDYVHTVGKKAELFTKVRDGLLSLVRELNTAIIFHQTADGEPVDAQAADLIGLLIEEREHAEERLRRVQPQLAGAYLDYVEAIDIGGFSVVPRKQAEADADEAEEAELEAAIEGAAAGPHG